MMRLKTFRGKTMAEALDQVKRQFGRDALILNTRTFTQGGVFGIGGKPCVEITAAPHNSDLPVRTPPARLRARSGRLGSAEGAAEPVSPRQPISTAPSSEALLAELGSVKSLVQDLLRENRRAQAGQLPEELFDTYRHLVEQEVAEHLAEQLIERVRGELDAQQLSDRRRVRVQLAAALEEMLPIAGPIQLTPTRGPTIIALIGPTGVGKTTTIAKLAANFCLREHRSVGLITVDTYRIAAVEQLKTYAQIINVPLEVVVTPEELQDAVQRMGELDVVLIDTAGRSQRDDTKIEELKRFFAQVRPHEVHLVLSSTCGEAVLTEAIDRFSEVGVDRVIFTKLDEALGFGVVLTCLNRAEAKLSYVTMGQDVPDDIEVGRGSRLAALILNAERNPKTPVEARASDRVQARAGTA